MGDTKLLGEAKVAEGGDYSVALHLLRQYGYNAHWGEARPQ